MNRSIRVRTPYSAKFLGWVIWWLWDMDECTFLRYSVPIQYVKPTQSVVRPEGIRYYETKQRLVSPGGGSPCGLRFKGDNRIFLSNGHHRLYVAKKRGRKTFRVTIWNLPFTLEWAMEQYAR